MDPCGPSRARAGAPAGRCGRHRAVAVARSSAGTRAAGRAWNPAPRRSGAATTPTPRRGATGRSPTASACHARRTRPSLRHRASPSPGRADERTRGSSRTALRAATAGTRPTTRGRAPRRVWRAARRGPLYRAAPIPRALGHGPIWSRRRRSSTFSRITRSSSDSVSATSSRGRDTDAVMPTASEYFKYVSIDATTTRASTVTRSMPTSETRTHASMTIPLSRTRSSTSMRELPLGERSTAIRAYSAGEKVLLLTACHSVGLGGELRQSALDALEPPLDFTRKKRARRCSRQPRIMAPPVQPDLLRFVDRAHEETHLDREQFDIREIDLDVTGDHQALVQHAVENLDQPVTARRRNEIGQAGTLRRPLPQPWLA